VTNGEGQALAASLGVPYAECSSLLNDGVQEAIETAVYMYMSFSPQRSSVKKRFLNSKSILPPAGTVKTSHAISDLILNGFMFYNTHSKMTLQI